MIGESNSSSAVDPTRRPTALTERQVAEQLGLSVATLRAWRTSRHGTAVPAAQTFGAVPAFGRGRLRPRERS
jgi:DNA-binding transcriptional regulator YiaG